MRATLLLAVISFGLHAQQTTIIYNQPLPVVQNGKFGFIDHQGNFVIKAQFQWASDFEDGFAEAYVCGREVSIDVTGKILPHRIPLGGAESVPRRRDNRVGFVDSTGKFKIPPTFDDARPFSDGMAPVKVGDKWGFIDKSGNIAIAPRFEDAYYFVEGIGVADLNGRTVLINRQGKEIASGFDPIFEIAEGRIVVNQGQLSGFIDFNGKVVVPLIYDSAGEFNGGLASVCHDSKCGYIDHDGNVSIPLQFDEADPFHGKLAAVTIGGTTGFIDRSGKLAFTLPYKFSAGFLYGDVGHFWTQDEKFGYVNDAGRVIWGPIVGDPFECRLMVGGWPDEDKAKSCEGFSESIRKLVSSFPP